MEAAAAFWAADYDLCLARLDGNASHEAAMLAARALLRQRRSSEAHGLLAMLARDVERHGSMRARAEHTMLYASALSQRQSPEASEAFRNARVLAIGSCDAGLLGEVEMLMGVVAFMAGDFDRAEAQAQHAADETADPVVNCWARQTRGAAAAVRGNLPAQLEAERENLAVLGTLPQRDVWLESWVLYNLSVLARELDRPDVAARVFERASTLRWTGATALQEFQTFRHLAYTAALRGDNIATFRHLRRSSEAAPSAGWKMQVTLDSAFFYRELGEPTAFMERVDAARELAQSVDWQATGGEERIALIELAELLAPTDPVAARESLATYQGLRKNIASHLIFSRDRRPLVMETHRRGLVAAALGDVLGARELLCEALAFWEERGIFWRAATAAIELAILTREGAHVERAALYAGRWPRSWFARRFETAGV